MKDVGLMVQKADGTIEPFSPSKLKRSLNRAGASPMVIQEITEHIQNTCRDGATTSDIYREAFKRLRESERGVAARYSLKRAVLDLGPTGFPFEDFIAAIYRGNGYQVATRQTVKGRCASHELDVVAHKGDEHICAELKFHNSPGMKSDLKVALYVAARYQDLDQNEKLNGGQKFTDKLLITNTKFTSQASKYGSCVGMTMVSWSHPSKGNLQDLIEASGLHPVTCLTTLSKAQKTRLLSSGHVLCRSLLKNPGALTEAGVHGKKLDQLVVEIGDLCQARTPR